MHTYRNPSGTTCGCTALDHLLCALSIIKKKMRNEKFSFLIFLIIPTSCPTDRGYRLKADRRLKYQLFYRCSTSMMLQACLLLQHLPLLQEVIHIPFSYSLLFFFVTFFICTRRGRVCLYCPHVLGGREACLGGGWRVRCLAWAG